MDRPGEPRLTSRNFGYHNAVWSTRTRVFETIVAIDVQVSSVCWPNMLVCSVQCLFGLAGTGVNWTVAGLYVLLNEETDLCFLIKFCFAKLAQKPGVGTLELLTPP